MNRRNLRHGLSKHPLYSVWSTMKRRCYNPSDKRYKNYGGRGICVCDEWLNNPRAYIEYVMNLPNAMKPRLTIDRIKNELGYFPGNLRWADYHTQSANSRLSALNTSGYTGVYFCNQKKKWRASIKVHGERIQLGRHWYIINAVKARNNYIITNNLTEYPIQVVQEKFM